MYMQVLSGDEKWDVSNRAIFEMCEYKGNPDDSIMHSNIRRKNAKGKGVRWFMILG